VALVPLPTVLAQGSIDVLAEALLPILLGFLLLGLVVLGAIVTTIGVALRPASRA
jgi:hypothetical protein